MSDVVELRCPEKTWRLFGKLTVTELRIVAGNLIEFSCRECSVKGVRVLHRYNMAGDLVESESVTIKEDE